MLVYLKYCFVGLAFPPGEKLAAVYLKFQAECEILDLMVV